jgi:hypothetical protein
LTRDRADLAAREAARVWPNPLPPHIGALVIAGVISSTGGESDA